METDSRPSSPQPGATQEASTPRTDRRKSGRATRKPELFSQSYGANEDATPSGAKRKRNTPGDDDNEDEAEDASESESGESNDEEPDAEELREKKRAARKAASKKASSGTKTKPKSRSSKKPKVASNGIGSQLAFRPATTNGKKPASRLRKPVIRPSLAAGEKGLYAEVFGKGRNADTTAADWLKSYQNDQVSAMREMVNFVIRCAGSDIEVVNEDITEIDHAPHRVADVSNQYHTLGFSDYPLISKSRTFRNFKAVLEDFFSTLILTLHHSSTLYKDPNLYENIQIWLAAISNSTCRPFRHTAIVIVLKVMNTLCDIAQELMTSISTSRKQLESEKRKKSVNKGRVEAIQSAVQEGDKKLELVDDILKDGVNIFFVHRYRDVDPTIRALCMISLGHWMRTYRDYFFEGQFLRYFGWILSDPVAHNRGVVVEELRPLYENKDNMAVLRTFNDRFRPRVVEMAAHDTDVEVRASAIVLVDVIRDAGLIKPEDIDTVGRLIFDLEPKVRKSAGRFFVANVEDAFESTIEEVGEELNEVFGDEDEDDFESPKRSWIKYKCLTDMLQAYDEQENELNPDRPVTASRDALSGTSVDSRFVLATEAVYPHFKELSQWQSLAGYLLYDHSQIEDEPSEDDTATVVKNLYKMEEGQEVILLEMLCCSVKLRVLEVAKSDIDKRGRKVKALTDKIPELQEEIAHSLAQIIPQLLNKFGSIPEAASAVLRLEHLVDLDKIQDMQKDATAYMTLLNDINKQFLTHSDQDVLAEASVAFLHAKSSDDMREALENKVQELWDGIVETLSTLSQKAEAAKGSSIPSATLNELTNTVSRISNLASVTDCTHVLETSPSRSKGKNKEGSEAPFNTLMHLAERGLREDEQDEDLASTESELVISSLRTLLFYFMWKVQSLRASLSAGKAAFNTAYFEALTKSREAFVSTLVAIMKERSDLDDIRFAAITTLLDLQTLFGTLRHAGQTASNDEDVILQTQSLVHEIDSNTQALIIKIHTAAERKYAKLRKSVLKHTDAEEPGSDSDVEREPSDDEDEIDSDDEGAVSEALRSSIIAEQRLCELTGKLVLAIVGRIVDASGDQQGKLKKALLRRKSRLGPNYREVVSFLAEPRSRGARSAPSKPKQAAPKNAPKTQPAANNKRANDHKSAERVDDEDEDEDEREHSPIEDDDDEDLRARGLIEDDIIDPDDDEEAPNHAAPDPDEDEIMGD
ncbi:putative nuclear cohesin complex subunit [Aspergillus steynii IBT 23096]|uniref:Putative nuclear cohesin complex subunit n=1 Tax=Aspergillus steynii IBT 23096 TaxID=1392250 RepID=A0A2I2GE09_9EURO|nr:putative nuclear cohesin complex subunit [Aspergillus steynii IBT 23096]PLB51125.1 putative nuclear cohesin complex subunit [Aspergillus steynii IBT 23096]